MTITAPRVARFLVCACLLYSAVLFGGEPAPPLGHGALAKRVGPSSLDRLPVDFIENRGQWDTPARFVARKGQMAAAFEPHAIRLHGSGQPASVGLVFESASTDVALLGEGKRPAVFNFFVGNNSSTWRSRVPAYSSVLYRGMYDGIDIRVREHREQFEYDLMVAPGTDLEKIIIRAEGTARLELTRDGALLLHTAGGSLRQTPPETVEVLPTGEVRPIESRFRIIDEHRYGFQVPARDDSLPMVIDPGLVWSTFTGGSLGESVAGIEVAADASGDVLISGLTTSPDFSMAPVPSAIFTQKSYVARVSAAGSSLVYLTFLGGLHGQTYAGPMVSHATGDVVVAGTTVDIDFPTTAGAYQRTLAGGGLDGTGDGFITRLDAAGGLVFSTFLGGNGHDAATSARFDSSGSLIVAGTTSSSDFPTTAGAYDRDFNAPPAGDRTAYPQDIFITRFDPTGAHITYSTYFGGQTYESITDMVIDSSGFITATGVTTSSATGRDMPVTPGAHDTSWNGSDDAIVVRFKLDGQGTADLKYSTFLGGINIEEAGGIALDPNDPELVTVGGWSWVDVFTTPRFPTTSGAWKPVLTPNPPASELFPHSKTGYLTRFRFPAAGGGSLVWSTFVGGNFEDMVTDVAVDEAGNAIVVGATRSYEFPTTRGAFDRTVAGFNDAAFDCFVNKFSPNGSQLLYSTLLGGTGEDCDSFVFNYGRLAYLGNNTVAVTGMTASADFPVTPGALVTSIDEVNNPNNPFLAKLTLAPDASGDLTADPPAALLSPANGASTDHASFVRFQWSDAPDPSGVEAYVYEMSTKPDFPSNFTYYKGSTSRPEIILSGFGTTVPWYWRIRTADRAGNISAWSAVSAFTTGLANALPTPNGVQFYPATVVGGTSPLAIVHLTGPAPAGGAEVKLLATDARGFIQTRVPVTVPDKITVPEGAITASFPLGTEPVSASTPVSIYATIGGMGERGSITVEPAPTGPKPVSVSFTPMTVTGGHGATGTVTLTAPAPAGGRAVPLLSNYPSIASVPASVTVPAGALSTTFPVTTSPVAFEINPTIHAVGGQNSTATLYVKPPGVSLTSFTATPGTVNGGQAITGTLTLSGPVPPSPYPASGGAIIKVTSSHPAVGFAPFVQVPVGASSATFSMGVKNVPATVTLTITASYDDTTLSRPVTVNGSSASLSSITLNVSTLTGGQGGVGFVNLSAPAPPGHVYVTLSSSDPAVLVPPDVLISEGSTQGLFSYGANHVEATTTGTITAAFGSSTRTASVTVNPGVTSAVSNLAISPSTVTAGSSATGTVTLNKPAPSGGASVMLSSWDAAAVVPSTVTVPAGASSTTFTITTTSVSAAKAIKIYAVLNTSWGAVLTVNPGGAQSTLSALAVSPVSVAGGTSSQGTVTLSAAAPSGGAVVTLNSSNTAVATVPASVTVGAGSTSATFTVGTQTVSSTTSVTISGTLGVTRSATLGVTPSTATPSAPTLVSPANGATVALPVTLDWNDVSAAASYQIQIDDQSSFSAPRVVDQTVTTSQFTASSLAARQHWWRVRGRNSAGTAGAWSTVRSFTPQAAPAPASLSAISFNPSTVAGGSPSTGTATLTSAAPAGGTVVTLTSSSTSATVPGSVTVAAGATTATFTAATTSVAASTPVTVTATSAGVTRTASLTVTPPATNVTLTVTATGRSGEKVMSSPAGINVSVGSTGSAPFATGTQITLSVSNGRDAVWSGACSTGGNKTKTCTFTIAANASVTGSVQ